MSATAYLISNSPGEVTTFVRPVLSALRRRHPDWEVVVALVPCPYATGAEAPVVRRWPERPQVWGPWQSAREVLLGTQRGRPGVVAFLGGEHWHALLMKNRFAMPCVSYFEKQIFWIDTRWGGGFEGTALGFPTEDPRYIGDLRVDAVRAHLSEVEPLVEKDRPRNLALFPGSRWMHLKAVLGVFLSVVDRLACSHPDWTFTVAASPFVKPGQLADAAAHPMSLGLATSRARLEDGFLLTEAGVPVQVVRSQPYQVIARCDLALSLPGTNTAELAIAGKPAVLPLTTRVPVGGGGLFGLLDRLPGLTFLQRRLRARKKERMKLLALPNQMAGRMVMPELMVQDDLSDLVEFVAGLMDSEESRKAIGEEARDVMGAPGASERFVDLMEEVLV